MKTTSVIFLLCAVLILLALSVCSNAQTEKAQAEGSSGLVLSRLQSVLDNQQAILQKLDDIKAELEIVKIRATRK